MKYTIISFFFGLIFVGCNENIPGQKKETMIDDSNRISTSFPSDHRIDTVSLNQITDKINDGVYPNIHSLLIAKNGTLFYEEYFNGPDQDFGKDIGVVDHGKDVLHDVRSISKSVVSACMGIAIDKRMVKGVDQKVLDFFPELDSIFIGEKRDWTIQHFLTMTTGMAWNERVPYNNPTNDEVRMTYSADPAVYALSKTLETSPGTAFNYSGGATQILAEIVERSSKMKLDDFVNQYLFDPIGIDTFKWNTFSVWNENPVIETFAAPSGLRLTSRGLMRIGLLYRNKGKWNGKQVISKKWIQESFIQRIEFPSIITKGNDAFGYQFWMWPDRIRDRDVNIVAAMGNGDQRIFWDLENDLIIVTTAGNYNDWGVENDTYSLVRNHLYPLILKEIEK